MVTLIRGRSCTKGFVATYCKKSYVCCDVISMGLNKLSCFKEHVRCVRFENAHNIN